MPFWVWLWVVAILLMIIGFIVYFFTRKKASIWPWIFMFLAFLLILVGLVFAFLEFRKRSAQYTTPGESLLSVVPPEYIPPALGHK